MSITAEHHAVVELVPLALVRYHLEIETAFTAHDEELLRQIRASSAEFERRCGQPIALRVITPLPEITGLGHDYLGLRQRPLSGLVKVEEETSWNVWVERDLASHRISCPNGRWRVESSLGFARGGRYRLTLSCGYREIPAEVVRIVLNHTLLEIAKGRVAKGEKRLGKKSQAAGAAAGDKAITVTWDRTEFDTDWERIIAEYRALP